MKLIKVLSRYSIARNFNEHQNLFLWVSIFGIVLFSTNAQSQTKHRPQHIYSAVAFGPDQRLWRLLPEQNFISVDYSLDYGKTFSKAVRINPLDQALNLWDENPPAIAVDKVGRIYVLYFADDNQESTSYFSYSDDGIHFSTPVKISSLADSSYHYQAEMLVDAESSIHFLWHDLRDKDEYKTQGGGDLSIYYTAINRLNNYAMHTEQRIASNICSCCRTAMAQDIDSKPVVLARFVYPGNIRDHGMLKLTATEQAPTAWRVTFDEWKIQGCPTHGPALSISSNGRYHMTWFTQGEKRTGLFYAWSNDKGKHFSKPLLLGDPKKLPGRADVLAQGKQVVLTWKEFDGLSTQIIAMHSRNNGRSWSKPQKLAESASQSAHPALVSDGKHIYLAWNSLDKGFVFIPVS